MKRSMEKITFLNVHKMAIQKIEDLVANPGDLTNFAPNFVTIKAGIRLSSLECFMMCLSEGLKN